MPAAERAAYDVIILGGGPAGSACALALAQRLGPEAAILVVERDAFPRRKVCGCCLNGAALSVLDSLGQGPLVQRLGGVPLHTWHARSAGGPVVTPLPGGFALSRSALDAALLHRVGEDGCEILQQVSGTIESEDAERIAVRLTGPKPEKEQTVTGRVVVVASGLAGGRLDRWLPWRRRPSGPIGAGTALQVDSADYRPGVVYMACGDDGYAGLVRLEDGQLDIAAALFNAAPRDSAMPLHQRVAAILQRAGFAPVPGLETSVWKGTPRLHRQRVAGRGRVIAIGDAAGYVEPFTGEGMAWAMRTAVLAADVIAATADCGSHDVGERYWRAYRRLLGFRRLPCRLAATALRYHGSRTWAMGTLSRAPWLARPVIRYLNRTF